VLPVLAALTPSRVMPPKSKRGGGKGGKDKLAAAREQAQKRAQEAAERRARELSSKASTAAGGSGGGAAEGGGGAGASGGAPGPCGIAEGGSVQKEAQAVGQSFITEFNRRLGDAVEAPDLAARDALLLRVSAIAGGVACPPWC